ncbi:MAG: exonuclease SbcCD subunit D [Chloroflexi bacterium]|nr:exonuclease SbcCD subunit D [Chloroflexota bacterium]
MRILHLADVHIGVENYGRPATDADIQALPGWFAPDTDHHQYLGMSTRLLDFLAVLDEAIEHALNNHIDLVLFAGDAYKSRDPTQTHQREFARRIARLARARIPTLLLVGNHDTPHVTGRATTLEIFPTLDVGEVYVADRLGTTVVNTPSGRVQVVTLPWIRRSQFLAREETRDMTLDQVTRLVEQRLSDLLAREVQALDPALPAVLSGHVSVSGARLSSEQNLMLGHDHQLLLGSVANPAFDYVALGHIHRHQVLSHNPLTAYSGSLQRVDFSEEEDKKGFCVVDLDPTRPRGERVNSFDFLEVQARPFLTVAVEVKPGQDPTEATLQAIGSRYLDGAIVRVRVTMPAEVEASFQEKAVRAALAGAQYVAALERIVHRQRRTRIPIETVGQLSPGEALRRYLESHTTSPQRARLLQERGEGLIRQVMESE